MPTQFESEMTCPELARDAAEMLIVGPNAKGQSPGAPDRGAPDPSKGALNANTPPSAPTSQYPGTALVWGAGLAMAVDTVPMKVPTNDTSPAANTFAIAIDRLLPAPCLDANAGGVWMGVAGDTDHQWHGWILDPCGLVAGNCAPRGTGSLWMSEGAGPCPFLTQRLVFVGQPVLRGRRESQSRSRWPTKSPARPHHPAPQ